MYSPTLSATTIAIALLWTFCLGLIVAPRGIVSQIWLADQRFDERVAASPLKRLCYRCGMPATRPAEFPDGSVLYFCQRHDLPWDARPGLRGENGLKGFNPWSCIITVFAVVGTNALRAWSRLFVATKWNNVTLLGAMIGFGTMLSAWWWFGELGR